MATTRKIIRHETVTNNFPNDSSVSIGNITHQASNTGSGQDLTITNATDTGTGGNQFGTVTLNTAAPESKDFTQLITIDDYRIADTVSGYNIPASRCSVDFNPSVSSSFTVSSAGSGVSIRATGSTTINSTTVNSSGTATNFTLARGDVPNLTQTGSDVTTQTGGLNQNTILNKIKILASSGNPDNSIPDTTITSVRCVIGGPLSRTWEADEIVIDGSDSSHTLPAFASAFTFTEDSFLVRDAGPVSVNTAFSLTEASENFVIAPSNTMASNFTTSTTRGLVFEPTVALASTFELQATTFNFVKMDPVTAASAFTMTIEPTFKPSTVTAITSAATLAESNKVIFDVEGDYTWNQFSNNPFIVSGYVKGGYTNDAEYEWDDLTTDTWNNWTFGTWIGDEANWDQWPGNTWNREFVFAGVFTMPDVDYLLTKFAVETLSSAFTLSDTAALLENPGAKTLASAFTLSATAQGVIDIPSTNLSSAFTLAVSDVDFKDNLEPLTLSSAFTLTATASHKQDTTQTIGSAFTFALSTVFVKYDITDTAPSAFTTDFVAHIKYAPTVTFSALASTLSEGLIDAIADPFNTITVDAETRTIVIPTENRITAIMEENRLNTIINENRLTKIMQETRTHKLKIPSITDRFATPRVRSET